MTIRHLHVGFSEEEFARVKKAKGKLTWQKWILGQVKEETEDENGHSSTSSG